MFREYLEKSINKYRKWVICSICVVLIVLLSVIYGEDINFTPTVSMSGFKSWYLPVITSLTGILFYYELMSYLSARIGEHKIITFISSNTFIIMQAHLFFVNIPNFYIYTMVHLGSAKYIRFNTEAFVRDAWYRYNENTRLLGFLLGLLGSLLVAWLLGFIRERTRYKKRNV